ELPRLARRRAGQRLRSRGRGLLPRLRRFRLASRVLRRALHPERRAREAPFHLLGLPRARSLGRTVRASDRAPSPKIPIPQAPTETARSFSQAQRGNAERAARRRRAEQIGRADSHRSRRAPRGKYLKRIPEAEVRLVPVADLREDVLHA